MDRYFMVMLGGASGTLARYLIGAAITARAGGRFPLGTVFINISGSFLVGFLMTILTQRWTNPNWRLLLVVGFLGGYTTFSAFEWENLVLLRDGARMAALLNGVGSVVVGLLAVWLGAALAAKK
ncbi:MAG TPA: fluoride efflux transporter CrcB [Bryobacteraceae bacterium]|nr:fluoride efflux transporter CrcB [Bryobacteraceae bacterium]